MDIKPAKAVKDKKTSSDKQKTKATGS